MTRGNLDTRVSVRSLVDVAIRPENTEIYTAVKGKEIIERLYDGATSAIPEELKDCFVQFCSYTGAGNMQIRIAAP